MYRLIIRQWPLPIEVKKQTLLDAALAAGVPYPHGCRTGECGSCKTRLLSGDVSMTAYDGAVLSQSERAEGLILVCRARPRSDVHIAWLGMDEEESLPTQRMMRSGNQCGGADAGYPTDLCVAGASASVRRRPICPPRLRHSAIPVLLDGEQAGRRGAGVSYPSGAQRCRKPLCGGSPQTR